MDSVPAWMAKLGIVDRTSGIEKAHSSRQQLVNMAGGAIAVFRGFGGMTVSNVVMMGLTSRAIGLHDGSVAALEADNPMATFTLIRAYAENAAAVEYAIEKPKSINKLMGMHGSSLSIGRITGHAMQSPNARFAEFRTNYRKLSNYAHPSATSILEFVNNLDANGFEMQMTPTFKSDNAFLTAASWIVEFANASTRLFAELAAYHGDDDKVVMLLDPPASH